MASRFGFAFDGAVLARVAECGAGGRPTSDSLYFNSGGEDGSVMGDLGGKGISVVAGELPLRLRSEGVIVGEGEEVVVGGGMEA